MAISDAVGLELISQVVGYKIGKFSSNNTSNLPQRIAILAEANTANQGDLSTDPFEFTSAKQVGDLLGYGSAAYMAARILRPVSGSGVGGIPTVIYPQAEAAGATAKEFEIVPVGTATANATHTLRIAGRTGLDGVFYTYNVAIGDTAAEITDKIADAANAVLGCPFSAASTTYEAVLTSKWKGLTAQDLTLEIEVNGVDAGISYSITETQAGTGTPSIAASLAQFDNEWNTVVVNTYGTNTNIMDALEAFNGIPDPNTPTGRYASIIMKPFFAFTGSVAEDPSSITDSRSLDVTIVICSAPLSLGHPLEAAANAAALYAPQAQNTPHLDISSRYYPDMPTPAAIGAMSEYLNRDAIVKKGCSTVELVAGRYRMADFVTTYHPDGETPPQFRYVRNLTIDWNIRYAYYLLEQINVIGKTITTDAAVISVAGVIKPIQWKQIIRQLAVDLETKGLIADSAFMQDSIVVGISTVNPDRLETFFRYKRSGFTRIASTTGEAGFNLGTI